MKKKLALLLAVLFVFALFAGCNNDSGTTPSAAPTDAGTDETATPTEDNSPYNFAPGNYEINDQGFPTAPYEYELPISTTDETFSFWTTVFTPQYLPEDGYGAMDFPKELQAMTGVNIEYIIVSPESRQENYSVLLAADDLCDMMTQATAFTTDTYEKNIEDEFWVNIYDYMEYCPNYIYQSTYDPADDMTYNTVFYKDDMIVAFFSLEQTAFISSNYMARADWLAEAGLTNDEIVTFDDVHNMLTLFKTNVDTCEFPWPMFKTIDMIGSYTFTAYDTLPYVDPYNVGPAYVVDGAVKFAHVNENDKEFMTMLSTWFSEGLIDPSWSSYDNNTAFTDKTVTGQVGYVFMSPGEVTGYEQGTTNDTDASWVPIHKPLKTEGQTLHVGGELSRVFYGSATISAKCENIPLVVSWLDYKYSTSGSFFSSYGVEGVLWEADENGNPVATDWALNNPNGLAFAWACMLYALDSLCEPGMEDGARKYIFPGGERLLAIHEYWADSDYDGAYKWPSGAKFTQEQTDEINVYSADVSTYLSENYLAFLDGSKPLTEWDAYVEGISSLGLDQIIAVYQEAYDVYMAS